MASFHLAEALFFRSCELKQPGDVKHAIKYLRYLQDRSLETSAVTRSDIKAYLACALAIQVKLESVDPMRDIGEALTLCRKLLTSGVSEPLLIHTVKALANAIYTTAVPLGQTLPDDAMECLREARIRLPELKQVRFALACSLLTRFSWDHSLDDYEEAMSIADEIIADPNENVEDAKYLAGMLAQHRFFFESKPEYLAEAIFRVRIHLNAMSPESPLRGVVTEVLAVFGKTRFEEFGVGSGWKEDNAEDSRTNPAPLYVRR